MRRLTTGGVWGAIEPVASAADGVADWPAIAASGSNSINATDTVWVTWVAEDNFQSQVWGWQVGSGNPHTARRPISAASTSFAIRGNEIVVDRAGNALAVWARSERFEASRYRAIANTWAEPLSDGAGVIGGFIGFGINSTGDALAWWLQFDADPSKANRTALQTRRFE
jgi:hypothetical protein